MLKLKKILLPTDFSRCAEQALAHTVFLAEKHSAEIHLLHVITLFEDQPLLVNDEIAETEEMIRKLEDMVEKQLNKVVNSHGSADLVINKITRRGISAAPIILEYASDQNIDLIVMGTHGRRGLGHLLLGSSTEEVVRMAKCPVFSVRESEKPKSLDAINKILVPVDFSDHSKSALADAAEIAESYRAQLQLFHVIEETMHPAYSLSGKSSKIDLVPGIEEDCRKKIRKMIQDTGISMEDTEIIIDSGQAALNIIKFANENLSDLIVIATHGLTGIEHFLLGSVTEKVVRMAPCPVFTVKVFGKNLNEE
jgi:nucleotide-binding universal stress UspA family protein